MSDLDKIALQSARLVMNYSRTPLDIVTCVRTLSKYICAESDMELYLECAKRNSNAAELHKVFNLDENSTE